MRSITCLHHLTVTWTSGDDTIVPNDVHACLVIRVLHTAQSDICGHAADIWVTDQPAGSSQYLGMLDGQLPCSQHQVPRSSQI